MSRMFLSPVPVCTCFPACCCSGHNLPTITFTLDFPKSDPEHFVLSVHSDGHATYDSIGKLTSLSEETDPFHLEFTISTASREHMFAMAKRTHYFDGRPGVQAAEPRVHRQENHRLSGRAKEHPGVVRQHYASCRAGVHRFLPAFVGDARIRKAPGNSTTAIRNWHSTMS